MIKKIEVYDVHTERGQGFELKISEDIDQGEFVGSLLLYNVKSRQDIELMELGETIVYDPVELRNKDKDKLIEACKERIIKFGGKITRWQKPA